MRGRYVIIPAGGTGSRMGSELPKQMLDLCGKPVLRRTVELFLEQPFEVRVIVSINHSIKDIWLEYCRKNDFVFPSVLITGGITRFHSVRKAMKYLPDGALAAVHDGVRPFVSQEVIARCYALAATELAVVPVVKVVETVRRLTDAGSITVNRDEYRLVQTPQVFDGEVLKQAYSQPYTSAFTDDASVVEAWGVPVTLTEGNRENIKITTPFDLKVAAALL